MMARTALAILILLCAFSVTAQESDELLVGVDGETAERLEAFNSNFLREELYFSTRHRIVNANSSLLLQGRDIVVTPFSDVASIHIKNIEVRRNGDDVIHWVGTMNDDPRLELLGFPDRLIVSAHSWDLDESGNALPSSANRFQHSPMWAFDENDNPILEAPPGADSQLVAVGPPPGTPEEIERHRRIKALDKHAFFSVSGVFQSAGGSTYVLKPLRFTPRYSVIYEISLETVIPIQFDHAPGERDALSDADRLRSERYEAFLESVPDEAEREIRGDVQ